MESLLQTDQTPAPTQTVTTSVVTAPPMMTTDAPFEGFDIDALIPKELREAAEAAGNVEPANPDTAQDTQQTTAPATEQTTEQQTETQQSDAIDDIVKQFVPDLAPNQNSETDDTPPFWMEDPAYKELTQYMNFSGTPLTLLEKLAQSITDKTTIESGTLVRGLETEKTNLAQKVEQYENEIIRLREIEREAIFDSLPETEEQYSRPMAQAATTIKNILDIEGSNIPLNKFLSAPNKTELNKLRNVTDMDDSQWDTVVKSWRTYHETQKELGNSRAQAKANLRSKLALNVTPERSKDTLRKAIIDLVTTDDKFKYIKKGIDEGYDKHEHVATILSTAQANFNAMLQAVTEPHSTVHDADKMKKLATFTLKAAHNNYYANQLPQLQTELAETKQKFEQVARAYWNLKQGASGKVGKTGLAVTPSSTNGNGAAKPASSEDADAAKYAKFLSSGMKLEMLD